MICIGNKTKFETLNGKEITVDSLESAVFFGVNAAGKSTFFNLMNKSIEYRFSDFSKNIFVWNGFSPIFITKEGRQSRVKRDIMSNEFDLEISYSFSKMSKDTYLESVADLGFKKASLNNKINIKNKARKFKQPKNFYVDFFILPLKKAIQTKKFFNEVVSKLSKKKFKKVCDAVLFKFKLYNFNEIFKEEEMTEYENLAAIVSSFHEGWLTTIIEKIQENNEIFKAIFEIYINELKTNIVAMNSWETRSVPKLPLEKEIKKIIKDCSIMGDSYGIKKFYKILNLIIDNITFTNTFVLDDPFEGMDLETQFELSRMFNKMMKLDVKLIIFTSSINGFRYLKNNRNKLESFLLYNPNRKHRIRVEKITNIDNIIFKYNNMEYYSDLKKLLNNVLISLEIRILILAFHRNILYETKLLVPLINTKYNNIEKKLEEIYDGFCDVAKLKSNVNILKLGANEKQSIMNAYVGNLKESMIVNLYKGTLNSSMYRKQYGEIIFSIILAKMMFVSLYDSAMKQIVVVSKYKEDFLNMKGRKNIIKRQQNNLEKYEKIRDYLSHPQEHIFVWSLVFKQNMDKAFSTVMNIINNLHDMVEKGE